MFSLKGIIAYHSCLETSEQNYVIEKKHQHVLNVAKTLFQSNVSLEYGGKGDFVLTTLLLINRLPTQVLDNKSPYEKLTSKPHEYQFLKSFGCLC